MYVAVFISLNNFICQVFQNCVHKFEKPCLIRERNGTPYVHSKRKAPAERVPDTSAGAGKKVTFVPQIFGIAPGFG